MSLKIFYLILSILFYSFVSVELHSFCGFYVAQAGSKLFNESSRVILVRNKDKTTVGMMNDYKGDLKDFALVIPVPNIIKKENIRIGKATPFDKIDAYTAPRLVDYFDGNPCEEEPKYIFRSRHARGLTDSVSGYTRTKGYTTADLGIKIEQSFTIGEYSIEVLSAKYSSGLETYLLQNNYKLPPGAAKAFVPYIKQDMKFFVAKVRIDLMNQTGSVFLKPIFFTYSSPKFMLPIRLGMINSENYQDLFLYILSKQGRVETVNYRTKPIPTNIELPEYVEDQFPSVYKALFSQMAQDDSMKNVYTEYFWNLNTKCDPCTVEEYTKGELDEIGVDWLKDIGDDVNRYNNLSNDVFLTRLHLRYTNESFPEDLLFQETEDYSSFQGRYVIHHPYPWKGNEFQCNCARKYLDNYERRQQEWIDNLSKLTGWNKNIIQSKIDSYAPDPEARKIRMEKIKRRSFYRTMPRKAKSLLQEWWDDIFR